MNITNTDMYKVGTDNDNGLSIDWLISNHCNYKCNYCDPSLYGNTSGWPNVDTALSFFDNVHFNLNNKEKMIVLSGGEPTLWPDLFYFLENLHPSYEVSFVSNGSRTLRWWQKINETDRLKNLVISVHLEYANVEHISSVIDVIRKKSKVTVFIVMNPSKIKEAKKFALDLKEKDPCCKILLKPVLHKHNDGNKSVFPYDNETLKFMEEWHYWKQNNNVSPSKIGNVLYINGNKTTMSFIDLINKRLNTFEGWKCNIIKNRLAISIDGTIKGATCKTAQDIRLGNINDSNIDLSDITKNSTICKDTWCGCIDDIKIPKEKV